MYDIEEWYFSYAKSVFYYAYTLCGNEDVAMDIMQTTFLDVIMSKNGYNGNCSVTTWLFSIAKHEYWKYLRKTKCNLSIDDAIGLEIPNSVEKNAEVTEMYHIIYNKMLSFNSTIKRIVILRYKFGLSFSEIAQLVGKNESYCRVYYYRVKHQIAAILEAGGFINE